MAGDVITTCSECGTPFVLTAAVQNAGSHPERCPMCRRLAPAPGRERGIVKWYSRAKGYGFITPTCGPDLFVHKTALDPTAPALRVGQLVEFVRVASARGVQAERVVLLEADG